MLYKDDVALVEKAVTFGFRDQDSCNAWQRIKKFVEEAQKTPTNKQSTPCAVCGKPNHKEALYCQWCGFTGASN